MANTGSLLAALPALNSAVAVVGGDGGIDGNASQPVVDAATAAVTAATAALNAVIAPPVDPAAEGQLSN